MQFDSIGVIYIFVYVSIFVSVCVSRSVRENISTEISAGWGGKVEREEGTFHLTPFCVV